MLNSPPSTTIGLYEYICHNIPEICGRGYNLFELNHISFILYVLTGCIFFLTILNKRRSLHKALVELSPSLAIGTFLRLFILLLQFRDPNFINSRKDATSVLKIIDFLLVSVLLLATLFFLYTSFRISIENFLASVFKGMCFIIVDILIFLVNIEKDAKLKQLFGLDSLYKGNYILNIAGQVSCGFVLLVLLTLLIIILKYIWKSVFAGPAQNNYKVSSVNHQPILN